MKVLVVDDHGLIRQAMHGMLKKLRRDIVVLEASDSDEAFDVIEKNRDVNLVLLDLTLPGRDGFSVLMDLREKYPAIPVVVLSAAQDPSQVMKAFGLGVLGYIPKSADSEVMRNALRLVLSGSTYIPPEILTHSGIPRLELASPPPAAKAPLDIGLTQRQMEVLALVVQGKNNKTICRTLDLAETTVKNHVSAILKALNVSSRTEAVIAVNELGWKMPLPGSNNTAG